MPRTPADTEEPSKRSGEARTARGRRAKRRQDTQASRIARRARKRKERGGDLPRPRKGVNMPGATAARRARRALDRETSERLAEMRRDDRTERRTLRQDTREEALREGKSRGQARRIARRAARARGTEQRQERRAYDQEQDAAYRALKDDANQAAYDRLAETVPGIAPYTTAKDMPSYYTPEHLQRIKGMGMEEEYRSITGADELRDPLAGHYKDALDPGEEGFGYIEGVGDRDPFTERHMAAFSQHIDPETGAYRGLDPGDVATARGHATTALGRLAQGGLDAAATRMQTGGIDMRGGTGYAAELSARRSMGEGLGKLEADIAGQQQQARETSRAAATDLAALASGDRRADLEARLRRAEAIESGAGVVSGLDQRALEHEREITEGRIQARKSRKDLKDAAEAMEPSGLEQASGIINGVVGAI